MASEKPSSLVTVPVIAHVSSGVGADNIVLPVISNVQASGTSVLPAGVPIKQEILSPEHEFEEDIQYLPAPLDGKQIISEASADASDESNLHTKNSLDPQNGSLPSKRLSQINPLAVATKSNEVVHENTRKNDDIEASNIDAKQLDQSVAPEAVNLNDVDLLSEMELNQATTVYPAAKLNDATITAQMYVDSVIPSERNEADPAAEMNLNHDEESSESELNEAAEIVSSNLSSEINKTTNNAESRLTFDMNHMKSDSPETNHLNKDAENSVNEESDEQSVDDSGVVTNNLKSTEEDRQSVKIENTPNKYTVETTKNLNDGSVDDDFIEDGLPHRETIDPVEKSRKSPDNNVSSKVLEENQKADETSLPSISSYLQSNHSTLEHNKHQQESKTNKPELENNFANTFDSLSMESTSIDHILDKPSQPPPLINPSDDLDDISNDSFGDMDKSQNDDSQPIDWEMEEKLLDEEHPK